MKKSAALLAALLLAVPVVSHAAVSNDEITSAKIREATAGSTSQDTNSGNGIKTGHIVDTAVTTAKIANGAVTDAKISGTISGSKLGIHAHNGGDLVNGTVTGNKLAAGAVTATAIADGAVTDAKISGAISAGKLPIGTSASSVAAGDHTHDTLYSKKYANVIVVAKSGGDYSDPIAAVNSITDASDANPYLVRIMPGVYDLSGTITMRDNIDLVGAGENVTKLRQTADAITLYFTSSGNSTANTIPTKTSVKNLSIEAVVAPSRSVIDMVMSSPLIENVTIVSPQGGFGIISAWGSPRYNNITFNLTGYYSSCIESQSSFTTIESMNCTSTGGSYNLGIRSYVNPVTIKNSTFTTTHQAVAIQGMNDTPPVINLINTQILSGTLDKWLGVIRCLNTYDATLNPVACP